MPVKLGDGFLLGTIIKAVIDPVEIRAPNITDRIVDAQSMRLIGRYEIS